MKYAVTVGGRTLEVEVRGGEVAVNGVSRTAVFTGLPHSPLKQLVLDGRSRTFAVARDGEAWLVQGGGERWVVEVVDERTRRLREMTGQRAHRAGGGVVRAPMPGLVLRVEVEPGQRVEAGAGVVVLEAMKMENEIRVPGGGTVQTVHVQAGQPVEKGAPLVELADQA